MRVRMIAAMLIGTVFGTQGWAMEMKAQQAVAKVTAAQTIDVPVGTVVPLNLVSPIKSLSTKPGDKVRAMVAFPVTVGDQLAIPAGTYVEGSVIQTMAPPTKKKVKKDPNAPPDLQVHFTKLLFANGYTVSLDAVNTAAMSAVDDSQMASVGSFDPYSLGGDGEAQSHGPSPEPQYTPLPAPTLPDEHHGPNPVAVSLGIVGAFVLLGTGLWLLTRNQKPSKIDRVLYDAGWQFQMTVQTPLQLDAAMVHDAATVPAQ